MSNEQKIEKIHALYTIEQCDNGVIIRTEEDDADDTVSVIEFAKKNTTGENDPKVIRHIGNELWSSIYYYMNRVLSNKVRIRMVMEAIDEEVGNTHPISFAENKENFKPFGVAD